MGVKNLWKLFEPTPFAEPTNLSVAIDISSWLYHLNNKNILYNTSLRLLNLLYKNTKPFFVLDNQPSFLKRLTLQKRKKEKEKAEKENFIRNIIYNRVCRKCNKLFRICEHATVELDEYFEKEYKKVVKIIDEHEYNWGDEYSEEDAVSETEVLGNDSSVGNVEFPELDSILSIINQSNTFLHNQVIGGSTNLVQKEQKLTQLLEQRKLRSLKLANSSNLEEFSVQQIKGVKIRNSVLSMINQLENKRIQSDCKKELFLSKEPNKLREFAFLGPKKQKTEEYIDEKVFSDEEDDIFKENKEVEHSDIETQKYSETSDQSQVNLDSKEKDAVLVGNKGSNTYLNGEPLEAIKEIPINLEESKRVDFENEKKSLYEQNVATIEPELPEKLKTPETLPQNVKFIEEINTLYISSLETIKIIIKAFNFPLIQSIGESDAQCAYMNKTGFVDAVFSDDNDIFVYGGLKLYRKYFTKSPSLYTNNYEQDFLIRMAYFLGSDYNLGIKNVGIKKAQALIDDLKDEDIRFLKDVYMNAPVKDVDKWIFKTSKSEIIKALKGLGMEAKQIEVLERLLKNCKCDYLCD